MAGRDFFDEDLVKHRDEVKRIKMGPADKPARVASPDPLDITPEAAIGGDFNLTRMMQRKQKIAGDAAMATEELERLRSRQTDLERQKKQLENVRNRISEFESGKREMLERINKSAVSLEKQEIKASTLAELLGSTRERFRQLRSDLQQLDESSWGESDFDEELALALTTIENARLEFNKTMAHIDSVTDEQRGGHGDYDHMSYAPPSVPTVDDKTWLDWLKIGFAITLPLFIALIILVILLAVYFVRAGYLGW